MSRYRSLRGVAHNLAQKFATSCEHFAYLAMSHAVPTITVDLLSVSVSPAQLSSDRNLNLVETCSADLHRFIASVKANPIHAAHITATFWQDPVTLAVCGRIKAIIQDDQQRLWTAVASNNPQVIST